MIGSRWREFYMTPSLVLTLLLLSAPQAGFSTEVPHSKKTYTYKTVGDCAIHVDVYQASDSKELPVIFWIHGGALIFGHREGINPDQLALYLNAGFVVVSIDYRLAPETKLSGILEDLQDAYAWVRNKGPGLFGADPNRIAVIGHSAGGYLTLTSGYRLRPRPKALVSFYGYGDITGPWYSQPDPFYSREPAVSKDKAYASIGKTPICEAYHEEDRFPFYLYCRQHGFWPKEVVGHDPEKEPRAFDPFSRFAMFPRVPSHAPVAWRPGHRRAF